MTTPADILRQAINYEISQMHTCLPATIVSYDYTEQKANVKPSLIKRYADGDLLELPIITNVPVIFPRTSNFSMHWPLNEGDKIALFFSERSIDEWLAKGGEIAPIDPRKFSLSDAIAIPGLYPFSDPSPAEDNENFSIQMGNAKIKISPDGKFCFNGVNEELMNIIDELFTLISSITTTVIVPPTGGIPAPGQPFSIDNSGAFDSLQNRFDTLKGNCS